VGVRPRSITALAAVIGVAWIASGCARGEALRSEAVARSESITFTSSDGTMLAGRLFGDFGARDGVVLAHMAGSDQSAWYVDAQRLADDGYRVLTYDARGTCPGGDAGCSEGEQEESLAPADLSAAVARLRSEGADRVAVVGASMGGTAALALAGTAPAGVETVIALSAPRSFGGLAVSPETLSSLTIPTLYIAGTGDSPYADDAQVMHGETAQPSDLVLVTSDDHGTDLLTGNAVGRVRDAIDAWLARHLRASEAS
jgi:pimeloyl-ACP methyl ester carboxylesterase